MQKVGAATRIAGEQYLMKFGRQMNFGVAPSGRANPQIEESGNEKVGIVSGQDGEHEVVVEMIG